jgi:BlaI family transcriptional regulator, penicillinase repressor
MRKALNRPTDTELSILRVLWDLGPATVRQVHEVLAPGREDLSYQAVLRMMQLMAEKGQLARDDGERSHVYRAVQPRSEVQGSLVDDLLERAFGGNALELLAATLSRRKMDPREREAVAQLLARAPKAKP